MTEIERFSAERAPKHCGIQCGNCCKVGGTDRVVLMTAEEAEQASKASGLKLNKQKPLRHVVRARGCPFHVDNKCSIYEVRPSGCRSYVCNGGSDAFEQHPEFVEFYAGILEKSGETADVRDWFSEDVDELISRHKKIALQFSGGKDSIATLEKMRPYWDRLAVYWLNTGDPFPEVLEVVDKVRSMVPNFIEVDGKRDEVFARYGRPSDVVPFSSAETAHVIGIGETIKLQDRFSCCARVVMQPMHQRMIDDDITLIIRGQRVEEKYKGKLRSGDVEHGIEYFYPIEDMSTSEVFTFIKQSGWEIPRYYTEGMPHSGDCLVCTAWVGDGRGAYLKEYHPLRYQEYRVKLAEVASAVYGAASNLVNELAVCGVEIKE